MNPIAARPLLLALLLFLLPAAVLAVSLQLELGEHGFDWTTVEDDRAHFRWSAEVANGGRVDVEARVSVELLDDDDTVVHRDSRTVMLTAGETRTVEKEGDLPFDRAADVVTFRFRIEPVTPESP